MKPNLTKQFDIIVVGSGAAGLYAALCLPQHYHVGLITKDTLQTGASDWAQGGIAAAVDPADSPHLHLKDTLQAGAGLCDPQAVDFLVTHAAEAIKSLVTLGVAFDRQGQKLAMTLEAAHSRPRVLHAADTTGRAIVSILTAKVLECSNIEVISQALVLSLWQHPPHQQVQGVSLLHQGQISWLRANAVILATGGGGQVFAQTTNPAVSTGDGVAIAWRAGARLRDLEFVQFHPTALTKPGAPHFLISEAVRGEGAHLIDAQGDRFAFQYHPAGELAPRDVVSRAIFKHLEKTAPDPANAHVYLDLRPIPTEKIRYRFPNIIRVCQKWGIDVFSELVPVAPAAHYWMGGIAVDISNRTSIPGLYALGETANTGVHGANRLASNSLLECIVYAAELSQLEVTPVGDEQGRWGEGEMDRAVAPSSIDWETDIQQIVAVRKQLPKLVWQSAGICRSEAVMVEAIAQIQSWREQFAQFRVTQTLLAPTPRQTQKFTFPAADTQLRICAETLNILDIAYLILKSAVFRTESRGGHYRTDYPETLPNWQVHTIIEGDRLATEPIARVGKV